MNRLISIAENNFGVSRARVSVWLANAYPPYLGAGIRTNFIADDFTRIDVCLKRKLWTTNYVGTQFGGNLFSMSDPWLMIMLMHKLKEAEMQSILPRSNAPGRGEPEQGLAAKSSQTQPRHIVWDKESTIRFRRPGFDDVFGRFVMASSTVEAIRSAALASPYGIAEPVFTCHLVQKRTGAGKEAPRSGVALATNDSAERTGDGPELAFEGTLPPTAEEEIVATVTKRLHVRRR